MIAMVETKDGGDYRVSDSGIELDNSIETISYIAEFGGNLKESTEPIRKPPGVFYNDFWGNVDVLTDNTEQFNSELERLLSELPVNSGNLQRIEGAAESDLQFLVDKQIAESVTATATIKNPGVLKITQVIKQPETEPESISFIWSETLERLEIL